MRNISAVQRPMPLTSTRRAISASSSSVGHSRGSSAPDVKWRGGGPQGLPLRPGQPPPRHRGIPQVAHAAADPNKVVRLAFEAAEAGFDPVRISDGYSSTINEAMFERLLTYDYLARPAKLVPMVAAAMPEVADDGRTYTFRLRK